MTLGAASDAGDKYPDGRPVTFVVTPINSLGQRGQPLTASRG